jgi:hypothetical protein
MAKLFLALSAFILVACGTEAKNLCPNNDCRTEKQKREQCAALGTGSFHEVTVKLNNSVPANIGVDIDGERRFDECTTANQKAPYVTVQRSAGNRVIVRVEHAGAYTALPTKMAINVINLQSCENRAAPVSVFTANDIALSFTKESSSSACPGRDVARVSVQQP